MPKTPTYVLVLAIVTTPRVLWACACGCGVFGVGFTIIFPEEDQGGMIFFEYDFMNQDQNWSGTVPAPAENNPDKNITTSFYNVGFQYQFDRDWGIMVKSPYWDRSFKRRSITPATSGHSTTESLGDIRVMGFYTGFSSDMSSGIIFGLKLPTGDYSYPYFDRDTESPTAKSWWCRERTTKPNERFALQRRPAARAAPTRRCLGHGVKRSS